MTQKYAILNATLYDGTGSEPFLADVVVKDTTISAILPAGTADTSAMSTIDATGLSLAPGFIDTHSHSDITIFKCPEATSKISQGVTTEIIGNCGFSHTTEQTTCGNYSWSDLASYREACTALHPAVNIAALAGHNSIRKQVLGTQNTQPTPDQLKQMRFLLDKALDEGACGFSSGLWYIPGKYSETPEVNYLAEALKGTNKPYATHMRSEGDELIEATQEAIEIASHGANRLEISHIKTALPQNWNKYDQLMETIDNGRKQGVAITADRYPYLYTCTKLRMALPDPFDQIADIKKYLNDTPNAVEAICARWNETYSPLWNRIIFCDSSNPEFEHLGGMTIQDIAEAQKTSSEVAYLTILSKVDYANAMFGKMCQENMDKFLALPWVMPGSDGYAIGCDYSIMRAHPRSFGTCPRFFNLATKHASVQEVIRRMTSLPAETFNLTQRGIIKPGYIADLVLFNPEEMNADMDARNPHKLSTGVYKTFVNGSLAFDRNNTTLRGNSGVFIAQ